MKFGFLLFKFDVHSPREGGFPLRITRALFRLDSLITLICRVGHMHSDSQALGPGARTPGKQAVAAVARKPAILLHGVWVKGEVYEPLRPRHGRAGAPQNHTYGSTMQMSGRLR